MKSITEYILEASKSPFDEIIDYAYEWLDYMYNEGVDEYNEKSIMSWIKNKAKPDYKDFAQGILKEFKGISKKTQDKLEKYIETYLETEKDIQVENAINAAINKFYGEYSEYLEKYA